MSAITLKKPMTEGGIRTINFFNGRMLSGEDLTQEQSANREARLRMGLTIGEGVASGLEVFETPTVSTKTSPVVTVTAGLALNREGQTLALAADTDVSLVRPLDGDASASTTGVFAQCQPPQSGVYIAGAGVYLLTITPATAGEGRAPVSGLGNVTAACNTRYTVEGVQFRLLQLDVTPAELGQPDLLRNLMAQKCFDAAVLQDFSANPFGPVPDQYGLLDELRPQRLLDSDVPLALLYWTTDGIQFIDLWAVRRSITPPTGISRWSLLVGERRRSEATAMFLQFADHMQTLRETTANLNTLVATQHFLYLPPVGILPLSDTGAVAGVSYQTFFDQQAYHPPVFIEEAVIEPLVRTALTYAPIVLQNQDPIRLYFVVSGATVRPYLIFVSAHAPLIGEARFDVMRWNFNNFV